MFKFNKIKTALFSTLLVASSVVWSQSSTEEIAVSLNITNGFSFTEVTPLTFGTVRATQTLTAGDTGGTPVPAVYDPAAFGAGLRINANGAAPTSIDEGSIDAAGLAATTPASVVSTMTSIVAGTAGEYLIAGAAPATNMTITAPDAFTLTDGSTAAFDVRITLADMLITTGPNAGSVVTGSNVLTDGTGSATILVGGTITIDQVITAPIDDGTYSGDYTLTVSY